MINRIQNKIYNIGNNQNKRILMPQNKPQINQISNTINNSQQKPLTSNVNLNNRNILNNNFFQNQNINNTNNNINTNVEPDEFSKALLMIKREFKKKDDRIIALEKKVQELTNTLNALTNNTSNNNIYNISSTTPYKTSQKGEYDLEGEDTTQKMGRVLRQRGGYNLGYSGLKNNFGIGNNNIRSVSQNNPNFNNYNSDTENAVKRYPGYDNLSHSNDNSVLTYNGVRSSSKKEVKNYLKEVKSKIDSKKFKEFIRNIKLLTAKNNSALNRDIIMENVKIIFGDEHKDLYIKFESIIGSGK